MGFLSVLSFAHKLVEERLGSGGRAIDGTVGTGADTLFLARAAGPKGEVYGFDIQSEALRSAEERLRQAREEGAGLAPSTLLLESHAAMKEVLPSSWEGNVDAVMFNFGYYPGEGSDKSIITLPDSSVAALAVSLDMLRPGGIITAVLYPGHPGGELEAAAVQDWASSLPQRSAGAIVYRQLQRSNAPYVVAVEKKKG
ncbi:class I SAM-dependent methyltransferase [Paenibacillus sp. HN-1]|uniref:class I SAM-dependent methyltransferase n=1 Tax=Paenibacillus TaxID=44249 RepID=UPI001CA80327|nr:MULTISPECIES: class I SAM-dependent methyltransferase [Paenibacillus]MBY9080873.1 class I SAM-dependent methyltransferase [Paenibacillus sp. CGMCC 1.18879]MBY9085135.1 class I SAM-dependent methyltransferase [Paenibacillus sinensis]